MGSYFLVRGISLFLGGYRNEFYIYEALVNGKMTQQSGSMFLYLVVMLLLTIFSIQRQLKLRAENLEMYSYKRYDFRYRRAANSKDGLLDTKTQYQAGGISQYRPVEGDEFEEEQ